MPTISMFYGITIKMFFSDHNPPHIHAVYAEYNGMFDILTYKMIEGDLPKRAVDLVSEWLEINKESLIIMWNDQNIYKLPGLK